MAHLTGKDLYRRLGRKIDGLTMRAPWNNILYEILKELYTPEEAELIVAFPYGFSTLPEVERITGYPKETLTGLLEGLCARGLVMDIKMRHTYRYMLSPIVIGIFEYTMMRTDPGVNRKKVAGLFHEYMLGSPDFSQANFRKGFSTSFARALPHEGTVLPSEFAEILDYEKATAIIENSKLFSIGLCSCRHEKQHSSERDCRVPLETCSTFGLGADYLIRRDLARSVSKQEMLENLARSKELGLVLCADNVRKNASFICHCCSCCCTLLQGISRFGYPNTVVTSSYLACTDCTACTGCGTCRRACPVNAIAMIESTDPVLKKKKPVIDTSLCLGCGVCALQCKSGSMKLTRRKARTMHPANTFEKLMLQCLERGTLQNQLFKNPGSITHTFMRAFIGGFLRLPPVKKALVSELFRSTFFSAIRSVG